MENSNKNHNKIADAQNTIDCVLEKIQKNEISIRSKTYFRARLIALISLTIAVIITSVFLFSFILFTIRATGQASLFGLVESPIKLFFTIFPWDLLLLDLILIFFLGWILRLYRFGYKSPVAYLLLGAFGFMAIGGIIIDQATTLHDDLLNQADRRQLPVFGSMYEHIRKSPPAEYGIYRGTITEISGATFQIELDNPRGFGTTTSLRVIFPDIAIIEGAQVGDRIFVSGKRLDNEIRALQFRDANSLPRPPRLDQESQYQWELNPATI